MPSNPGAVIHGHAHRLGHRTAPAIDHASLVLEGAPPAFVRRMMIDRKGVHFSSIQQVGALKKLQGLVDKTPEPAPVSRILPAPPNMEQRHGMLANLSKTAAPDQPAPLEAGQSGVSAKWVRRAGVAAALSAMATGGWLGGLWGLLMALLGGTLMLLTLREQTAAQAAGASTDRSVHAPSHAASASRDPAMMNRMVSEVVTLWVRQAQLSRETNQQGIDKLLNSFAMVSDLLTSLSQQLEDFRPNVAAGATGEAIDTQRPALEALMAPMRRAFAQRDEMLQQVQACNQILGTLQQWSKDIRDLAQHTRMVAFNASIESARQHANTQDQGSGQSISTEIRRVSEGIVAICDRLDALIRPLQEVGHQVHQHGLICDTNDEQLRIEVESQARQALNALFEALGGSMSSGRALQECGQALNSQMEEAFTHFQFGDRVAQMMEIFTLDMERMVTWAEHHPQPPTQADIQDWVDQLESKYTMAEQRSQHHEMTVVDRSGVVEFF